MYNYPKMMVLAMEKAWDAAWRGTVIRATLRSHAMVQLIAPAFTGSCPAYT